MIKPDCYNSIGKILDIIFAAGFSISNLKMRRLSLAEVQEFYAEHVGKPFYENLTKFISSDVVVGMELVAENAVVK